MNTKLLKFVRENLKIIDNEWVPNEKSSFWYYSSIFPFYPILIAFKLNSRRKSIEIYKSMIIKR